jgi:hypothetical protein
MRITRGCRGWLVTVLCLAGCSHSEPFTNPDRENEGPFSTAAPVRLTYNAGEDLTPAVDPSGATTLYAFTAPELPDGDQCLSDLPLAGGTATSLCPRSAGARDSTDRYERPAWLDDSTLVFLRGVRPAGGLRDQALALGTAPFADPSQFTPRLQFPFLDARGILQETGEFPTPLPDGRLAYVGMSTLFSPDCRQCATLAGRGVYVLALSGTDPPTFVAGTASATGLSTGAEPGELLFTIVGDSRVYRRSADGTVTVVHDFGEIARSIQYRGGRLAAVIGGSVAVYATDAGELYQIDSGGRLAVHDLASGQTYLAPSTLIVQRLSLTPDGGSVVVSADVPTTNLYRVDIP